MAYDPARRTTTIFGGTEAFSVPLGSTYVYRQGVWASPPDPAISPSPRSLFGFVTDPTNSVIWLLGGMDATDTLSDIWKYSNGTWHELPFDATAPAACISPSAAFDTDRAKIVLVCQDASLYEFDGTTWKTFSSVDLKVHPQVRRFSAIAYDPSLKKTVLFGGYNDVNYLSDTWEWDGTAWTQEKNNLPSSRSHAAMWYDPVMKKTVIYGGIGQRSTNDAIERFSDMWSFDGNGWTQMTSVTNTPGQRYGSQVSVDPTSNSVYLFGGLKLIIDNAKQSQVYQNDLWKWDGTQWTQLATNAVPPERENGGMAFDPISGDTVLFAGYAGFYRSDLWSLRSGQWLLRADPLPQPRRRGAHH
jgi:hypothetical protein